jgi:hypothetical protein
MLHRFSHRDVNVPPWVFVLWLVTVVIAGVLVTLSADGGFIR